MGDCFGFLTTKCCLNQKEVVWHGIHCLPSDLAVEATYPPRQSKRFCLKLSTKPHAPYHHKLNFCHQRLACCGSIPFTILQKLYNRFHQSQSCNSKNVMIPLTIASTLQHVTHETQCGHHRPALWRRCPQDLLSQT